MGSDIPTHHFTTDIHTYFNMIYTPFYYGYTHFLLTIYTLFAIGYTHYSHEYLSFPQVLNLMT
jgi:hypothetical protein